ncbi:hypothetical protein C7972_107154 [Arenibacter sp. ARW7G5Y1]|nr:hypothetical protein C7972_107154 [Arenibacter sp. ARW7G5Y1]
MIYRFELETAKIYADESLNKKTDLTYVRNCYGFLFTWYFWPNYLDIYNCMARNIGNSQTIFLRNSRKMSTTILM